MMTFLLSLRQAMRLLLTEMQRLSLFHQNWKVQPEIQESRQEQVWAKVLRQALQPLKVHHARESQQACENLLWRARQMTSRLEGLVDTGM